MEMEEERRPIFATSRDRTISYQRYLNPDERAGEYGNLGNRENEGQDQEELVKVYTRRWYVLSVFCLLNSTQNILWNTWGPVSDSVTLVFGWSDAEIGLFVTLGNLSYSLTVFISSYIMDVLGLRIAALSMAALMVVGASIRCITSHGIILYWMSVISALLGGVASTVTLAGPALFASVWFPPSQRATANAIINLFNFAGVSFSFLLGPGIVHYVNPENTSDVQADLTFPHGAWQRVDIFSPNNLDLTSTYSNRSISKQREEIMHYMYTVAGIAAFLFLLVLVYFPARPPLPPSFSASTTRLDFRSGLWKLTKSSSFWLIGLAYGIPAGVFAVWGTVLNVNLQPIGISQETAGRIGLFYYLAGGVAGVGVSRFADLFSGHMKMTLIVLYVLASGAICWISLIIQAIIPFNTVSLFTAAILASVFVNSGVALFNELSCETCYPVAEGIIGGYLTLLNNLTGILFLCVLYIPNIGTSWMTWTMLGATIVGIFLLLTVRVRYARLEVDSGEAEDEAPSLPRVPESGSVQNTS